MRYVLDARRAFLADEQGLGKTVEALAALDHVAAAPVNFETVALLEVAVHRGARAGVHLVDKGEPVIGVAGGQRHPL